MYMLVFDSKHLQMSELIRSGASVPLLFLKLNIFIADAIYNTKSIYTHYIRNEYAMHSLLSSLIHIFFSIDGSLRTCGYVLHLFTVCRTSMKNPLWICHEQCVCCIRFARDLENDY